MYLEDYQKKLMDIIANARDKAKFEKLLGITLDDHMVETISKSFAEAGREQEAQQKRLRAIKDAVLEVQAMASPRVPEEVKNYPGRESIYKLITARPAQKTKRNFAEHQAVYDSVVASRTQPKKRERSTGNNMGLTSKILDMMEADREAGAAAKKAAEIAYGKKLMESK